MLQGRPVGTNNDKGGRPSPGSSTSGQQRRHALSHNDTLKRDMMPQALSLPIWSTKCSLHKGITSGPTKTKQEATLG